MENIPLSVLFSCLAVLLALSAFFSLSETAMMASNRFRLRHLAQAGNKGAQKSLELLNKTDKMLGVILLGNNLINSAAAMLVSIISIQLFGNDELALGIATLLVTFAILVFSEITPKVIGATHSDRLALILGYLLTPLLKLFYPAVWFVNLFSSALLKLLRLQPERNDSTPQLSPEELRSLVLESSHLIPQKHQAILSSLFDLNQITVEDLMTPRGSIEILDIDQDWESVREQLSTSHHSRLPVCRESLDQLLGILPVRRLLPTFGTAEELNHTSLLEQLQAPYYIPAGTPAFSQLAFFQENRQRIGFVVDEYGEILGLLTLEDIIEEFVGDFTTSLPTLGQRLVWSEDNTVIVDGGRPLRDLNRTLGLDFPLDGPKTLNGLILEHFQDIPESGMSIKVCDVPVEILQTEDRSVVTARIYRPEAS
ncbi:HlyC/CorC family transporter [Azonexus sp. IMCC34839]|uniref:HlyC/CorC family transporter n=1 Tax=Azonexus sp. IMCC34839 TaxID=3133695 RepID=UPI0039995580